MQEKIGDFTIRIIIDKVGHDPPMPLMNQLDTIEVFLNEPKECRCEYCDHKLAEQPKPYYTSVTKRGHTQTTVGDYEDLEDMIAAAVKSIIENHINMDGITSEKEK